MELDDLKSIWKKGGAYPTKDEAEIATMLKGTSNSIVSKLKRSVWIELTFTLCAGVALLVYALTLSSGPVKWASISILILFVGYTIYYIKKLILLKRYDVESANIKSNLEQLVSNLTEYLRYYKLSYTILYPVYFLLGLLFGGLGNGYDNFLRTVSKPQTLAYLLVIAVIFYVSGTYLVNWLLKKLYGNHLDKLKKLLEDIHSEKEV